MQTKSVKRLLLTLALATCLTACERTTVKFLSDYCQFSKPIPNGDDVPVDIQAAINGHNAVYIERCENDDSF